MEQSDWSVCNNCNHAWSNMGKLSVLIVGSESNHDCTFLWEHTELLSVLGIIYNNYYDNIMNYLVTVNEQCMTQQEERSHENT